MVNDSILESLRGPESEGAVEQLLKGGPYKKDGYGFPPKKLLVRQSPKLPGR